MTGKTHAICGTTALVTYIAFNTSAVSIGLSTVNPAIGLVSVAMGSYAPDIDIPDSHLGRKFKIISKHLTHRGITHTLLVPFVLYCVINYLSLSTIVASIIFGFLFGYVMHLFADMFNKKGIPLLWPLMTKHFYIMTIKTRSATETMFMVIWVVVCVGAAFLGRVL